MNILDKDCMSHSIDISLLCTSFRASSLLYVKKKLYDKLISSSNYTIYYYSGSLPIRISYIKESASNERNMSSFVTLKTNDVHLASWLKLNA